jgi:phospholipid/cholesterol/gamma-HCH transport system substrate-binding protein
MRVAAGLLAVATLAGCGGFKGAYSLPLPGGAATGKTYTVSAQFDDVQDLVPENAVRVNDVAVGDITGITVGHDPLSGKIVADVTMKLRSSVRLPANAVATLQQTTLLGEKYVALSPPAHTPPVGQLKNGAKIAEASTSDLPDVEEVFGALSQVLNGGDLGDLQTINIEITKALSGREQQVRGALKQLDTFVSGLDTQKQQIVRALDQLARFTGELSRQRATIATALDDFGPGLKVLADERAQFTDLLTKLSTFGRVASHVINASRADTIDDLRDLQPVLGHLAAAGSNLPHALEILISFPFPKGFTRATPGDYAGLRLSFAADPIFCAILGAAGSAVLPKTCPKMDTEGPLTTPGTTTQRKSTGSSGATPAPTPTSPLGIVKKLVPTPTAPSDGMLGGLLNGVTGGAR